VPAHAIDTVLPVVDPTAFVHPTAVLIGDVVAGAGCYVGPEGRAMPLREFRQPDRLPGAPGAPGV
jgi:hypothetical protein